ncbi:MAG: hypothetical protein GEV10_01185 [Streptosporangiales bacterium]|nr:hypothetical protein [Streptosporangiales bacterium]
MNEEMVLKTLQLTHLEKLYGYLPGMVDALPSIFGLDKDRYAELTEGFAVHARQAAQELLDDDAFASAVDALPFAPGQTVLAVGDSMTDDLQSWAEILRHVLELLRPDDGVRIVNGGLSAHTTAMVLRRWVPTVAQRPDWIICFLGGNDVTRVGPEPTKSQVSTAETVANLRELHRIAAARADASWVWITPAPVHEERVAAFPPFRMGESTWRNDDIVALTEAMRDFPEPVVDLTTVFGVPAADDLQGPDGVHASLAGQQAVTRALVTRLVS